VLCGAELEPLGTYIRSKPEIERIGTLVPVRGTIVPFGDFAGTVPAIPAVG
jgi:hypothetical protein